MKTLKLKYVLGSIIMGLITLISVQQPEKYHVLIPIIFGILFLVSISLMLSDKNTKEYVVIDSKSDKKIKSFVAEEEAIKFANEQDKDTKVVMLML
jgi:hypothetical protein